MKVVIALAHFKTADLLFVCDFEAQIENLVNSCAPKHLVVPPLYGLSNLEIMLSIFNQAGFSEIIDLELDSS